MLLLYTGLTSLWTGGACGALFLAKFKGCLFFGLSWGDFNCIPGEEERVGGKTATYYEMKDQLNYFLQSGLMEGSCFSCLHTRDVGTVKYRLDMFMFNSFFLEVFPLASAHFFLEVVCLIILHVL